MRPGSPGLGTDLAPTAEALCQSPKVSGGLVTNDPRRLALRHLRLEFAAAFVFARRGPHVGHIALAKAWLPAGLAVNTGSVPQLDSTPFAGFPSAVPCTAVGPRDPRRDSIAFGTCKCAESYVGTIPKATRIIPAASRRPRRTTRRDLADSHPDEQSDRRPNRGHAPRASGCRLGSAWGRRGNAAGSLLGPALARCRIGSDRFDQWAESG